MDEKNEQQFLRIIIDHVTQPIFVKDRSQNWVFVNRAFCELVGASYDDVIGKDDFAFASKEDAELFRARDLELFERRLPVTTDETSFTGDNGRRYSILSTKVPIVADGGEVHFVVGIVQDLTEWRGAEDRLRRENEELERRVEERTIALQRAQLDLLRKEKLTELGKLAGGVAHEIRNPL
ncbi:MAG: PAS domain S-box protein, partial [Polyangiaceae bacterium]